MNGEILAILPAYNEEVSIGSIVLHTRQHADRIIVIDDGSTDRTAEVAELAGAEVIRHSFNKGKGAALKTGFEAASHNGTEVIVTMDAGGQHDPEEIPKLAAPILAGEADVVNGSRYINGSGKNTPFYRRIGQSVLDKATNLNSGLRITDTQSGFRAFAAHTVHVFRFSENGFGIESEMLADAANAGLRIKEVEIGVEYKKRDTEGKITIAAMPAFNEEKYIAKTIIGCEKYVDEVIVVDDGSTDATAEIAEALGAIVIKHPENKGYGAALQTIFKTAREMNADTMVILDSDGQHNPGEIPQLLKPLNNGADVVIGSRFIQTTDIPAYRKTGMKILDTATNIAGSIKVSDSQSGYRAYSKKAINEININGTGMSGGSEILLQVKEHDLKLAEVPINCRYDLEDISTHNPVSHGFSVLMSILNYVGEKRPVLFLGLPGTILILIGVFYGVWTLQIYASFKTLAIGNALISVMTTLIGVFSVFTTIILYTITNFMQRAGLIKRA